MYDYVNPQPTWATTLAWLIFLAFYIVAVAGLWKMYTKAGEPGWAAIIPLYNWWVWVKIIGRPRWWFWAMVAAILLSWIPLLGWLVTIVVAVLWLLGCLDMARAFGHGLGYGLLLWVVPMIMAPVLGFGSSRYVGRRAAY